MRIEKYIFLITSFILVFLSIAERQISLNLFVLFSYLLVFTFINYKSVVKDNLIHISLMAISVSLAIFFENISFELYAISILPLSLIFSSWKKNKIDVFFCTQLAGCFAFFISGVLYLGAYRDLALIFFLVGLPLRQIQFPFHFWIKNIVKQRELYPSFLYLILCQSGFLIYSEHIFVNDSLDFFRFFIPIITLMTGLLTSVGALRTKTILTRHLFLILSQSCLPLAAYHSYSTTSATGGIMFSLVIATSGAVFGLIAYHIYIQKGIVDLNKYYSLHRVDKSLGSIYLISGLSLVGLPFTMGYIAEDILFHGLIISNPFFAVIYIATTAINGFTIYKTFSHLFFGHTQEKWTSLYFKRANTTFMKISIFLIVLGGLLSGPLATKIEEKLIRQDQSLTTRMMK